MKTKSKITNSYWVKIYMAGDVKIAKHICQEFCLVGLCVNITECEYIYTGGRELGFVVELLNYARFPKSITELKFTARSLAETLLEKLFQASCTILTPEISEYIYREDIKK